MTKGVNGLTSGCSMASLLVPGSGGIAPPSLRSQLPNDVGIARISRGVSETAFDGRRLFDGAQLRISAGRLGALVELIESTSEAREGALSVCRKTRRRLGNRP